MNEKPTEDGADRQKKPYSAPTVEKVPLRAEEAVLGFCKNDNGPGRAAPSAGRRLLRTQGS